MDEIQRDLDQSVYTVAGPVLGAQFTKARFPLAGEFFAKVVQDAGVGVGPIKTRYKKARPFQFSPQVTSPENIAKAAMSPTYPSGHSSTGAAVALLLGMMVPEHRDALYARGWEYGFNRVRSGVAWPSDWEGGHLLATVAVHQMMKNAAFMADFDAVKAEVRQGLGLR
jgi:acid phosphatase (class A)